MKDEMEQAAQAAQEQEKDRQAASQEAQVEAPPEPDLQGELEQTRDQLMRLAAEFENYKKRMKNEQDKRLKYEGEEILRSLLPSVDNLERALSQGGDSQADAELRLNGLLEGVALTHKSLVSTLERFGLQALEAVGQPFNPQEQEAMSMEASSELPSNHVLREFARGYRFKDRILRPAMVVVSSGPGPEGKAAD